MEVEDRKAEKERIQAVELQKVVLKRAIKLREDRKLSVARQEVAKQARLEALRLFKQHLAKNLIIKEERDVAQQARYSRAIADLRTESSTWITLDNLDAKITPELFELPATTGLHTRHSESWRYTCTTEELDRLLAMNSLDSVANSSGNDASLTDRLSFRAGYNFVKKSQVADLLNQMIGTGDERAQYGELVDKYVKILTELDAFHEPKEEFDALSDLMMGDNNDNDFDDENDDDDDDDDNYNNNNNNEDRNNEDKK